MMNTETLAPPGRKRKSRVSSLTRMTQILDHLLESGEPLSPYAIAKGTGAPVSTVYVTIDEMVNARLLSRNADGSIWIGDRLYYYGLAYSSKLQLFEEAKREMTELRDEVKETVQICARDRTSLVVQQMATGPGQFRVASDIGSRLPLNWTASGLLLIGHLPMDERIALMKDSAVESPTGRAETDPTRLAEIAGKVYQDRLAIQDGQADELVCCIASPVCNEEGECLVTISVVLANSKVEKNADYYIAAVTRASQRLERRMGWLG